MKGPPGIGKSALARALGKHLSWPVADKDDASDVLMTHLEPYGFAAYQVMFAQAGSLVGQGFSVIVDSPLRSKEAFVNAVTLAQKTQADAKVLECFCSDASVWRKRLETRERRPAHVLKTWADFERYWHLAERDFDYDMSVPALKLDMLKPLSETTETVLDWLRKET